MRLENMSLWAFLFIVNAMMLFLEVMHAANMWWVDKLHGTIAANAFFWMAADIFGMLINEKEFFAWVRDEDQEWY